MTSSLAINPLTGLATDGLGGTTGGGQGGGGDVFIQQGSALTATGGNFVNTLGVIPTGTPGSHLVINAVLDASITALQTSNLAEYNGYVSAINTAIAYFDNLILNPITLTVDFGWNEVNGTTLPAGAAGQSTAPLDTFTYAQLYAAVNSTFSAGSALQQAALASLSNTDPTGGASFTVNYGEELALGLTPSSAPVQGWVGINSTLSWAFTQSSLTDSTYDAIGVIEHEISEVLGRSDNGGASNQYSLLDLFRYTAAGNATNASPGTAVGALDQPFVAGYSASNQSYFSPNGQTVTLLYAAPSEVAAGSDIADWIGTAQGDAFGSAYNGTVGAISATDVQTMAVLGYAVACFAQGTRIATPQGDVAIEALSVGDLVLTAENEAIPVIWLGHRQVDCLRHPKPEEVWPVRIRAGAFAPALPCRDLLVSPEHALLVDGFLMPARALINGTTIVQEQVAAITWWHLELPSHDAILAEHLPAESYLDTGNRAAFENAGPGVHQHIHPRFGRLVHTALACAPFADTGRHVARARARLIARAAQLGHARAPGTWWVEADGTTLPAQQDGGYLVPAGTHAVALRSTASRVIDLVPGADDARTLGVCLSGLAIDGAALALDDARLGAGFHTLEQTDGRHFRWTDGAAMLPGEMFVDGAHLAIEIGHVCDIWQQVPQALAA